MKIRLEKTNGGFNVIFDRNSKKVGTFDMQINGEILFFPADNVGGWSFQALNLVAEELKKLNKL